MTESSSGAGKRSERPAVSVVVPSIGRPELIRALNSVRAQTADADVEVIVVDDSGRKDRLPNGAQAIADMVIRTAGGVGGSGARNLGISRASGDYVALLDDDDEWMPHKLEAQLALLRSAPDCKRAVVAGRQVYVDKRSGSSSQPGPKRLIAHDETVEHYLFRRRSPNASRASMYTSTLMCPKELAVSVPWDGSLARHQDWDWLIRLGRTPGTTFHQTAEPIVRIQLGSSRSISAGTDWEASLAWADRLLSEDPEIYCDFVVAQSLRYALTARSSRGVRTVLGALLRRQRFPALGPAIVGVAGVLPRQTFERVVVATSRKRA